MPSLKWWLGDDAVILRETNFQLLITAAILPVLGTSLLSPVLDSLIGPFATSASNIGLLVSVFTAPAIVIIPVIGLLADKYGRKPVLVASITLYGVAGTAIIFTADFRLALAFRFVQGIGFGGINPILITSIGDIYSGTREATGQGLRFMVAGLSGAVFPLLAGALVTVSWQYPFLIYALAIPIAVAVLVWFDEPERSQESTEKQYRHELYAFLSHRRIQAVVLARALPVAVWIAFITYNSIIVARLIGGTPLQAGLLVTVGSTILAIVASQAGRITDIFDNRFLPLAGASLCLTLGLTVLLVAPTIGVAMVGTALVGVGTGITLSLYRSVITGMAPPSLRAGVVSISESASMLAATLTPVVMSALITALSPAVGFTMGVKLAGVAIAVVGGIGSLGSLAVARGSAPLPTREADDRTE